MMKILHSADWHLDAPILGRTPEQTQLLRQTLLQIPGKIAALCKVEIPFLADGSGYSI